MNMICLTFRIRFSVLLLSCLLIFLQLQSVDDLFELATDEKNSLNQSVSVGSPMKQSYLTIEGKPKNGTPVANLRVKKNPSKGTLAQAKEVPNKNADVWMLCELNENTTVARFRHLPHAAQTLLPCWSWFQRMRRQLIVASKTSRCGFYIQDTVRMMIKPGQWIDELIKHTGCSLISSADPLLIDNQANASLANNSKLFYSFPVREQPFQFFEIVEDARTLRAQVLRSLGIPHGNCTSNQIPRIAIINRRKSRRFVNGDIILDALRQAYPSAEFELAFMEDMTPAEQFKFWAQHDVIVAGHGAALTNLFFMPPCRTSAIVEIFPHHFYAPHFDNLHKSAGIRWYGYYDNLTEDAINVERATYMSTPEDRTKWRSQDFDTSPEIILNLVHQAVSDGFSHE